MGVAVGEELTAQDTPHQAGDPAPPRPHTEMYRVSCRHVDHELGCVVLRGIGFSWRCTCGARGKITGDRSEALEAKRKHEAEHQR